MNKIFKVIWNEARNAYVVVSEIAKNHGSKSCSTKKLLAMLIATGVMTCASFDVLAAEPSGTDTAKSQYVAFADPTHTLYSGNKTTIDGHEYIYDATNKYWVRKGYVLTVDTNGGKYTPLSENAIRADVAYTGTDVPKGILQSVTSTVSASGTVTNMGESLNKITAGSFAGVSHAGGTVVAGSWDYIIKDASWEGNKDGYVNLYAGKTATAPKGFVNTDSNDLIWDDSRQAYFYKNQRVDYSNMYVINGKLGVFTNADSTKVYTGTVYGKNNEILMTVKDKDNNFYSYWAAEVTDPSATMATYRVEEYNKNLAKLVENDDALNRNDIKEVTLTKGENSATIGLMRNGDKAVDGAITVTSGGGTGGKDTFVKISNAADTEGKTFATGSKVEVNGPKNAITGIKVNGVYYAINNKVYTAGANVNIDENNVISATDTTYTAGNGIAISGENHAIAVKLKEGENNLEVTEAGLELKKALTVNSVKAGDTIVNTNGLAIGTGDRGIVLSTNNVSMGGQQIHNVAKGTNDNDAVNVSQLKETNTKVENLKVEAGKHTTLVAGENVQLNQENTDKGLQYTINAKDTTYAAGNGITISGANNEISVKVKVGENNLQVTDAGLELKKDLTVDSVKAGSSFMSATGIGYGDKAYITSSGLNANNQKITGVAAGTIAAGSTDAVNGSQLNDIKNSINTDISNKTFGLKDDKGSEVTSTLGNTVQVKGADGITSTVKDGALEIGLKLQEGSNLVVNSNGLALNTALTGIQSINGTGAGSISFADGGNVKVNDVTIEKGGKITGVAAGTTEKDAVNFGQLDATNKKVDNLTTEVGKGWVVATENGTATKVGAGDTVKFSGADNNIKVSNDGTNVKVELNKDLTVDSVKAGDFFMDKNEGVGYKGKAYITSSGLNANGQTITNVKAGEDETDAVNVGQLNAVKETANKGWKLKTNNGNVSDVKPGDEVEFDGDANIQVGNDGNKVSVTLKKQLTGIQSITGEGEGAGSISFANDGIKFNNKVTIDNTGKISGVANGITDNDAVNVSQLNKVSAAAKTEVVKGTNIDSVVASTATDGHTVYTVNAKGTSVSVDGNFNLNTTTDDETNVTNYGISLKDSVTIGGTHAVTINGTDGTVTGLTNTTWNKDSITSGRAATEDQLQAVATEAGKHTTLSNGKNTTVESTVKDGQTDYKVNVAGDLTDITSVANGDSKINLNKDSIIISNGNKYFAITNSGIGMSYIGADYSAKSIMLGENGTTISGGLNVAGSKITGVAAGVADTDAVNVGQLKEAVQAGNTDTHIKPGEYGVGADNKVNMDVVDKNGNKVDTVTIKDVAKASDVGDVSKIADDLKNGGNKPTTVVDAVNNLNNKVGDLQYSKVEKGDIADGDSTTTAIGKLDQKLTDVEATAAKHTKVEGGNNITVTNTAQEGEAANYKVELKKDIDVDTVKATTVTTGQTVMNNDGVKVGKDVSVTATAVTAGKTSISDEGVKVGDKTYISADGLNANDKKVTNVADGKVEKDSKDAINGGQLHQAKADINNRIDGVENQVISNSIGQLSNRVNKVGAGAAALAALHPMDFDPDDKLTFSAGYGNYGGENAAAIGAYYRPDEKVMFSVGGTVGNGENMVNAGVSFALDRTNHVSNSRTALAREVIDLRGQLAVMGAKMAKMEKALGMLDETKTKLFPDIPANHWAYEYIAKLAGNGYIEGYPDGNFGGDRLMTRYEFAAMLYRAIENGAALEEKIIKEFEPELGRIRVDRISGEDGDRDKIERVRVNDTKGERDHYGNKLAK